MLKRLVAVGALAACAGIGVTVTATPGNPVAERQALMKSVGAAMGKSAGYATGRAPWDAAKAAGLMKTVSANAKKSVALFPAGSGADKSSAATPKIWAAKADFNRRLSEMSKLADMAAKAKTADQFKSSFAQLGGTCKGCHDTYRGKKG